MAGLQDARLSFLLKCLTSAQTAVFDVPSAVVSKERSICLSLTHPDFQAIETVEVAPFQIPDALTFGNSKYFLESLNREKPDEKDQLV